MAESMEDTQKKLKIKCPGCGQKLDVTSIQAFTKINCPVCNCEIIVPRWFENYLLESPISTDGFTEIYKSLDLALEREIAIELLKQDSEEDVPRNELFLHEAKTTAALNHYAVVPVYTCGKSEGLPYIAMQYMSGGSLEKKIRLYGSSIPLPDIVQWMLNIAEGLKHAAENNVLHHDIRPSNILFDGEGNAKLCDFGLAQILASHDAVKYSDVSRLLYNPYYISPEKVSTGQEGQEGDVYSLGAVFYHVITGRPPYVHDDPAELIRMRLSVPPSAPEKFRKDTDAGLSCLLLAMLSQNPEERPSYKDIISTLARLKQAMSLQNDRNPTSGDIPAKQPKSYSAARRKIRMRHSRTVMKTILGFLNTLIGFGIVGAVFALWYHGYLEKWLPFNISLAHAEAPLVIADPNPEISWHLAHGNWQNAILYSSTAMNDTQQKSSERVVAMFQYTCACLLGSETTAGVRDKIASNIKQTEDNMDAVSIRKSDVVPLLSLVRYMARLQTEEPDYEEIYPMQTVAYFLLAVYDREPVGKIRERLNSVTAYLDDMPKTHWLVKSFLPRLSRWKQVINERSGVKEETEPLLRRYVEKELPWQEKSTADDVMEFPADWHVRQGNGGQTK